jgi:hypothetical protein
MWTTVRTSRVSARIRTVAASTLVAASLFVASRADAFTYSDEDLLLVFRQDGYNDVEYNLGNIGWLLALPAGGSATITNWDSSLLAANYGPTLTDGVLVALISSAGLQSTNTVSWTTSATTNATYDLAPSGWRLLWSKISGVGTDAETFTANSATENVSIDPSSRYSYTYLASDTGVQPALVPTLGGASPFILETTLPGDLSLVELGPSGAAVKPLAPVLGTFHIDAVGNLSYTAAGGEVAPAPVLITGVSLGGGSVSVTFNTEAGVNYRLRYATELGAGQFWTSVGSSVAGAGGSATLHDTVGAASRFYVVESFH